MPFEKGHNHGKGRPKGAANKETKQLREFLAEVADKNQAKFNQELNKLEGRDYINAYLTMLEYCTPKLQRAEIQQNHTWDLSGLNEDELRNLNTITSKIGDNLRVA